MKLLIDIGNSQVKLSYCNDNSIGETKFFEHDEFLLWLKADDTPVKEVVFANVAGEKFDNAIKIWALTKGISFTQVYSEAELFGIRCGYHQPSQLGIDRWLAILGAEKLYPKLNLVIVDIGTATTIDVLTAQKRHLGGWILPGYEIMHQSVLNSTTKVFSDINQQANLCFGQNTSDNVNHGCWAALSGAIHVAIEQSNKMNFTIDKVLVTGGQGQSLQTVLPTESEYLPNLVFHGLLRYCHNE